MIVDLTAVQEFKSKGFLVVPDVVDYNTILSIRKELTSLINNPDEFPKGVVLNSEGATVANKDSKAAKMNDVRGAAFLVRFIPFFQKIAQEKKLLEYVRGILGPSIRVFRDQALFKPPGGQKKPIHQDQSYFRIDPPDDLITAWIAIDDATSVNGCMHYIPESHKYGLLPIKKDPHRPVHHIPNTDHLNLLPSVSCPVKAGSVIFHHGCTLHFSERNNSQDWRRAIIFHYTTKNAFSENRELNNQISLELD